MRIVGVTRVSTDDQAKTGGSLATQAEKIRLFAQLRDHALIDILVDDGYSGKSLERPGIQRALEMLKTGEVEGLVVSNLDRLTRSLKDLNWLLETYFHPRSGIQLMSVSDSLDTSTAAGVLVINILMSVAQWQRMYIVERTKDELDRRRRSGHRTGEVPYGCRLDDDPSGPVSKTNRPVRLLPNEGELAVMALVADWDDAGWTLRQICAEMVARGIPTRRGRGPWYPQTVSLLLQRIRTQRKGSETNGTHQDPGDVAGPDVHAPAP